MDKKVSFGVEGFSVIDDYSDNQLAIVEIYVCHDGNNLHNMPIELSVLKAAKNTLKNKFLVAGFDGNDFEGHEPDEQIVGFFPESSKMTFKEKDGKKYLVAQAIMSKVYAKWAYDVFAEGEENYRAVSMEITVLGTEVRDDGLEHITKFVFNGVTLLGNSHMPACEGANASIIKFSTENALKLYSKHFKKSNAIKEDFIKNMGLAKNSGKEEEVAMEKEEKEIIKEETLETEVESPEEVEEDEKEKSDEKTYMEETSEEEKSLEEDEEEGKEKSEEKQEEADFESLTVEQKFEIFRSAVKESLSGCGCLESFDDEYLYVYDYCENNIYRYSYALNGTSCELDIESKTRVMRGGYVEFESYEEQSDKITNLENENNKLKEKLAQYEVAEKEKNVESILSEVVEILSPERIAEFREEASKYSLEELSVFENKVKADAFEAVQNQVKEKKYSFNKMTINEEITNKTSKYGW